MKLFDNKKFDVMFYDASKWAGEQLRLSWITGGHFYKMFRSLEEVKGCLGWHEALEYLISVQPERKIDSIQFWGHGSPGTVWINGETLNMRSLLASSKHRALLLKLKERLSSDSVVWFRSCNVAATSEGQLFMQSLANILGCRIAAHTFIVHPWQSGLHTVGPGEEPDWPVDEGVSVNKDGSLKMLISKPWSPNTVFCLTSKIPKGW
jgi:hypothetical protein